MSNDYFFIVHEHYKELNAEICSNSVYQIVEKLVPVKIHYFKTEELADEYINSKTNTYFKQCKNSIEFSYRYFISGKYYFEKIKQKL
jgi:hypothetical protein